MTYQQAAIIGLLVAMLGFYALDRFRPEVVALSGLAIAFLLGLVPLNRVFAGFSSPAVVTVVEILLIVGVLTRARIVERFARAIVDRLNGERAVLAMICIAGAAVSVFMNNIGALALMFPVALSVCARLDISPGRMLMPLSFATLLGGICSLTGTPANLVVNDWLIKETGGSFGYFTIGIVGFPVTAVGIAWLVIATPWFFRNMQTTPALAPDLGPGEFVCEVAIATSSPFAGRSLDEVERSADIHVYGIVRDGKHVFARRADITVAAGDILTVEGEMERLDALRSEGVLDPLLGLQGNASRMDVVVMPDSTILGSRVGSLESFIAQGVAILGVASRRRRVEGRFEDLQLGLGDVLLLAGDRDAIRHIAADASVLPLSIRAPSRSHPTALRSLLFFVLGVAATATGLAPPEIAFGAVVIAMVLSGALRLREGFQDLNWPIIILLASMIPLGMAVQDTGAAQVIANHLVMRLPTTEPLLVTAVVLLLAISITPFVDNVSTAAVLSPIAANIATRAGVPIEPLLVAVAVGASLDFLTPFGHHNNSVVMGAAGYKFLDFPRLGLPLLAICTFVAILLLGRVWM